MRKVYIIAEAGVNHNGELSVARQLIDVAVEAGADAIKFQTFKAEQLVSQYAPKAEYQKLSTHQTESQMAMLKKLELGTDEHDELYKYCQQKGVEFLSTAFDLESLEILSSQFNLSRFKIPSGELTNPLLLLSVAEKGKPVILSTGMCGLQEIETALGTLAFGFLNSKESPSLRAFRTAYYSNEGYECLKKNVTLLHCTTEYPSPFQDVNLRAMETLRTAFNLDVGLSDHTEGIAVPIAAAARGACVIEKHFTLSRELPGPDHRASLEPRELIQMIQSIRQVQQALGDSRKIPSPSEIKNIVAARKSLVAALPIKKGEIFTKDNLGVKRPGNGISPMLFWEWLGKQAPRDYETDELID